MSEGRSFYCPKCCVGENAKKIELLTEEQVIQRGAVRLEVGDEMEMSRQFQVSLPSPINEEIVDHDEKRIKVL